MVWGWCYYGDGYLRDAVPMELCVCGGGVEHTEGDDVGHTLRLVKNSLHVRHGVSVIKRHTLTRAQHGVNLLMTSLYT